jgi:hypothetical protein
MKRSLFLTLPLLAVTAALRCGPSGSEPEPGAVAQGFERLQDGAVVTDRASTGGVSWVDLEGDGDLDLVVTNGYDVSAENPVPQPNRVYLNGGDGTFSALLEGPLVELEGFSSGSTWGDYDNDGDPDVFVSNQRDQDNALFRNEGGGRFTHLAESLPSRDGGHSYAASWIDVDGDGHLDLFVANGGLSHQGRNFLYRNRGDGTFARVEQGPLVESEGGTCGFAWGDYDGDGDPDVFVSDRSFGAPAAGGGLYRNEGGWAFTRVEEAPFDEGGVPSSAADWGDYDGDGDLDLVVAAFYGLANALYRNEGEGRFHRVREGEVVVDGGHTYALAWGDRDNDGDLDLLVANWGAAPVLYDGDGRGGLSRAEAGDLGRALAFAGSAAWGDLEGDGDLDLYLGSWPNRPGEEERNQLYRNRGGGGSWLGVRLQGTRSNRSGIGAVIAATTLEGAEARTQVRQIVAHTGWRSQGPLLAHFGLGEAEVVRELVVRWPSGTVDRLASVPAGQIVTVTEGQAPARRVTPD